MCVWSHWFLRQENEIVTRNTKDKRFHCRLFGSLDKELRQEHNNSSSDLSSTLSRPQNTTAKNVFTNKENKKVEKHSS